ncbi:MAG: phosphate ABC transporter permease PstA [Acidimicrobiales bacterium]
MASGASSLPLGPDGPVSVTTRGISRSRRVSNRIWWALCALSLVFLVTPVVWILAGVFDRGVSGWHWSVLWTKEAGVAGGLSNDIVGTLLITFGTALIAGVVGVGAGVYLSEFGRPGIVRTVLRSASEVLSGVPSIVFGYVGYVALVIGLHWQFSLLAALIVLSMLVVPYIAKATEISLNQVPTAYREGADALGMAKSRQLRTILLRSAMPGMLTGIVIAIAISIGETAPLLYTAGSSVDYPTGALTHSPVGYLTYSVYADFQSPFKTQHTLSNDAAMILVLLVVALILATRVIVRITQRYSPEAGVRGGSRRGPNKSARPGRFRVRKDESGATQAIAQAAIATDSPRDGPSSG